MRFYFHRNLKNSTRLFGIALIAVGSFWVVVVAKADGIKTGDEVLVRTYGAAVWQNEEPIDTISRMTYFKVEQVKGGKLLGTFSSTVMSRMRGDEKPVIGWVSLEDVIPANRFKALSKKETNRSGELPPNTRIFVLSGDPAPDENGRFAFFESPIMNNRGEVAFGAVLLETKGGKHDDRGVFIADDSKVAQIAREGQTLPGNQGVIAELGSSFDGAILTTCNDVGQVAFQMIIGEDSARRVVCRGDANELTVIAEIGATVPAGDTKFTHFATFPDFGQVINDSGEVVVWADMGKLRPNNSTRMGDTGIFVGDGRKIRQILRNKAQLPSTKRRVRLQESKYGLATTLNNHGQLALKIDLSDESGRNSDLKGGRVVRSDGKELVWIARPGLPVSAGESAELLYLFSHPVINHHGHVAFAAFYLKNQTSPASKDGDGIYFSEAKEEYEIVEIIRAGRTVPDGNGWFSNFQVRQMNAAGQIGFFATLSGVKLDPKRSEKIMDYIKLVTKFDTSGLPPKVSIFGLFRSEPGEKRITPIVRTGQDSPDGNGVIIGVNNCGMVLNDSGQVSFKAGLTATDGENVYDQAVFFYDDKQGLAIIARTDTPFLGSKLTGLYSLAKERGDDRGCLNADGQVTYGFRLADKREGIAVWTPPASTVKVPKP